MKNYFSFRPKLMDSLKDYSAQTFVADLTAGLTVGIVALPLALAIASGLKPEVGIFTAIIGGLLVSLLGGSRLQIGGPAGAFMLTVFLDLPTAVGTSLILASAFLVKRLAETAHIEPDAEVTQGNSPGRQIGGKNVPDGVVLFRIFGAFFFGRRTNSNRHCGTPANAGGFDFADARRARTRRNGFGCVGRFIRKAETQEKRFNFVRSTFAAIVRTDAGRFSGPAGHVECLRGHGGRTGSCVDAAKEK